MTIKNKIIYLLLIIHITISSCATTNDGELILVIVNDATITKDDLIYSLNITHRREDLSSAGRLDIHKYIQKLVDEKLIINEARIAGLENDPEIKNKVNAFILRESVTKLHEEEILSKIKTKDTKSRKEEEKKISDEYLKNLRSKSTININKGLIDEISKLINEGREIDKNIYDNVIASVNSENLTVKELVKNLSNKKPTKDIKLEQLIDAWIDRKLIDMEALSRNYLNNTEFRKKVTRYEDKLLKNLFIKRIIAPQIRIEEDDLLTYYEKNKSKYLKPVEFKIKQITVKNKEKAQEILDAIQKGSDFSWFAKKFSIDIYSEKGGDAGWLKKESLSEPIKKVIDSLKEGEISPIIEDGDVYRIIKLSERSKETYETFEKVKEDIIRDCFNEKITELINDYINKLKKDSHISINEEEVKRFEAQFNI
jgi:peptidyl-prolyl cis-trans isomerase C